MPACTVAARFLVDGDDTAAAATAQRIGRTVASVLRQRGRVAVLVVAGADGEVHVAVEADAVSPLAADGAVALELAAALDALDARDAGPGDASDGEAAAVALVDGRRVRVLLDAPAPAVSP